MMARAPLGALLVSAGTVISVARGGAAVPRGVAFTEEGETLVLSGRSYVSAWSAEDGRLLNFRQTSPSSASLLTEGGELWRVRFADGSGVSAGELVGEARAGRFSHDWDGASVVLTLRFESDAVGLVVRVRPREKFLELRAEVVHCDVPILRVDLPARVVFPRDGLRGVVFPQRAGKSVGIELRRGYFEEHGGDRATAYEPVRVGPAPYSLLTGGPVRQLADDEGEARLRVTEEGLRWFGPEQVRLIEGQPMCINRPPESGGMSITLVDSDAGPALCAGDLGGDGLFLRFCGRGRGDVPQDETCQLSMILGAVGHLATTRPETFAGKAVALIALRNGPEYGTWTAPSVARWRKALAAAVFVRSGGARLEVIDTPAGLRQALTSGRVAAIVNPYGEWLPTGDADTWREDIERIRGFVRSGGIWCEVGGHPFYYVLAVKPYLSYTEQYPSANADLVHISHEDGGLAMYGVQPLMRQPWEGKDDPSRLTVPAELTVGGEPRGGTFRHGWHAAIEPGQGWISPWLRLHPVTEAGEAVRQYADAIGLDRSLAAKVGPSLLAKLRGSVLIRLGGATAEEQVVALDLLPPNNIVHFAEYLHGGFDKQYPDHLPPRSSWGTAADLGRFYRRGKELGHLMMPYVNTSWWCIGPKGPTFEREGEGPLSRRRDGALIKERYAANEGYSVCFWHRAVQEAHRKTRQQMTEEFASDILLQDQVGARGWSWDYNPAAPSRTAGLDGMHSLSMEDATRVPLATEDGYDRVAQFETMLCGMGWAIVPSGGVRERGRNLYQFPAGEWRIFPLMQYLAHDKAVFTLHDLGQFVTGIEHQAYTLALGYSMSYRCSAGTLRTPRDRRWLYWLDAVQKGVCSLYTGEPLRQFSYPLAGGGSPLADDVILAQYGGVRVVANVGATPVLLGEAAEVSGPGEPRSRLRLAGPGFYAWADGLEAGFVEGEEGAGRPHGFVSVRDGAETRTVVFGSSAASVRLCLPGGGGHVESARARDLAAGDGPGPLERVEAENRPDGTVRVSLPEGGAAEDRVPMPEAVKGQAPPTWRERSRTIAVLDMGQDMPTSWVKMRAGEWLQCIGGSATLARHGFRALAVRSPADLRRLCEARGEARPFAVVNPGGEHTYAESLADGPSMLGVIREYVRTGGIWWETGGYSFYVCSTPVGGEEGVRRWETRPVGPSGAGYFGFSCSGHPVESPPEALSATVAGQEWYGPERTRRIEASASGVQRPFEGDREEVVLVRGERDDFVAAVRCGGWGWLWRLGGFNPDPAVAREAVLGVLEHLATRPWPEPVRPRTPGLWEVRMAARPR